MKHWDLFPNEPVTLTCEDVKLTGRYLFRDTRNGSFAIKAADGESYFRQFELQDDGGLRDPILGRAMVVHQVRAGDGAEYNSAAATRIVKARRKYWIIEGADRNTRGLAEPAWSPKDAA
jgi:hypothetical protein